MDLNINRQLDMRKLKVNFKTIFVTNKFITRIIYIAQIIFFIMAVIMYEMRDEFMYYAYLFMSLIMAIIVIIKINNEINNIHKIGGGRKARYY